MFLRPGFHLKYMIHQARGNGWIIVDEGGRYVTFTPTSYLEALIELHKLSVKQVAGDEQ